MAVLNLKLDGIFSFKNFEVNFSFPSKLRTSLIEDEHLKYVPSFRYKKLNVFVGSNASGKTSLIKAIWGTLLFLKNKEMGFITKMVNPAYKNSTIEIDLVIDSENNHELHRFKIITENGTKKNIVVSHNSLKLSDAPTSSDSYENKVRVLDSMPDDFVDYLDALNNIQLPIGWNMTLPATEEDFDKIYLYRLRKGDQIKDYLDILSRVFKTLDPAILSVKMSKDTNNAVVVEYYNNKIIVQNGMPIASIPFLSSGTKYAVNISNIIYSIKHHLHGIYLIDEQFSYVNSDVEEAMLSTMVSLLGQNEQLFFTTHNTNILSMRYPFHSFYFLKKECYNGESTIKISCGSEAENRNNASPKTIIDNDIFNTAPDVNKIYEIGEED